MREKEYMFRSISYRNLNIATKNYKTAYYDYLRFYTHKLKVGIPIAIAGGSHLKSGVGKTYTAIRTGELHDKDYKEGTAAMEKIVFEPKEFANAMEGIENKRGIIGQTIIIDEAGILVNAQKWFTFINQAMKDTVITFRELRGLAIFVTPTVGILDKTIRHYCTHSGICYKHVATDSKQVVLMSFYANSWDDNTGRLWKKQPVMYLQENKRLAKFHHFKVQYPKNKELIEEYEKKMKKYKSKVRGALKQIEMMDKTIDQLVDDVVEDKSLHSKHKITGEINVYSSDVQYALGVTQRKAEMIARKAQYRLEDDRTNKLSN